MQEHMSERALISWMCYCPFKIYAIFEQLDEILVFTKKTVDEVINGSHVELVVMQKLVE